MHDIKQGHEKARYTFNKQRIKLNHNIIYTTTCDVPIIDYLINHRSKSLSDAIIIYLLLMKSQPIPNTSFCSIAQFPVLIFSFVFLLN